MKLWIAEKPDMGRKIAKALGGGNETRGFIKINANETVTWAIGHLLESLMPHEYDLKYKKWQMGDLPIIPKKFMDKVQDGKQAQLEVVTNLIGKATTIVVATDAGREGEAIAWKILDHAGWQGGAERLWTSSLGEDHLKKAVKQLIDDSGKKALYVASKLRAAMDWSDGINLSRAYNIRLTNYGDKPLSLGRVQTATLAILVDRDNEILNFKPSDFYDLKAIMSTANGNIELMHSPTETKRIKDKTEANKIAKKAEGLDANLKVIAKPVTMVPPPPFSLPELQMAASSKWGWGAKKTLDVLQKLYEGGAVTYPRTDAGCLSEDMKAVMPKHLTALQKQPGFEKLAKIKPVIRKSVFNNAKIEDHHGIIPTDEIKNMSKFGQDEQKLFDLVAKRFLAALMPDAKGLRTTISCSLAGKIFKTSGTMLKTAGWKEVWGKEEDPTENANNQKKSGEGKILPSVTDGEKAHSDKVEVIAKTTKPPAHYTEGTLLKAMIGAGSGSDDKEIRDLLSNGGLGTQATRQEIIEKLKYRDFARANGKKIISTERARDFISIIREDGGRLADVQATADLERHLREVEKDPSKMPGIWHGYVKQLRQEIADMKLNPPKRKLMPSPRNDNQNKAPYNKSSTSKRKPSKYPVSKGSYKNTKRKTI